MNGTHLKLWKYMEKAQSWPSQVFGCFLCQRSFLQVILISWEQVRMTHKLCFGDTCKCVSVLDENSSASLSIKKKRFLQVPVLPQTMKIKATGLCRLYVCVHSVSQMGKESGYLRSHPAALIFTTASLWWLSMPSPSPFQFHREAVNTQQGNISARKYGHHWQWVTVKTSVSISEMAGREQVILQQGIIAVPLNSIKLNKQHKVRPEAEERFTDMTLFFFFLKGSASVFPNNLRFWIPVHCILEQAEK